MQSLVRTWSFLKQFLRPVSEVMMANICRIALIFFFFKFFNQSIDAFRPTDVSGSQSSSDLGNFASSTLRGGSGNCLNPPAARTATDVTAVAAWTVMEFTNCQWKAHTALSPTHLQLSGKKEKNASQEKWLTCLKKEDGLLVFFFSAVLIFSSIFSKDNYLGKYFININVSLKFATFLGIRVVC